MRVGPRRPGAVYAIFIANAVLVLMLWWFGSGALPVKTLADRLNAVGRVTALLGTYLILWQLLMLARVPWLESAIGLERLARLHRWNAYPALGLILAHTVFQTIGYQLEGGLGLAQQLGDFIQHYEGLLMAIVGLVLMIAVTVASVTIARRRMAYETWYFVHLYAYLAVALAFSHQLATGEDFVDHPLFVAYWWTLYAAVTAALVVYRLLVPLARYARHQFRVERVQPEASGAVSIYVGGRDLGGLDWEAGQFMLWRFLDPQRWWEAHPFTLSTVPNGRYLRLTVKGIGDFTSRLEHLRPGTPVLVEGPFGHFTRRSCRRLKALLIAGGIGITPIRSLAEEMGSEGLDVCVLYRCGREREIAFRGELDQLRSQHGIRVEYLLSDHPFLGRAASEWLRPANLLTLVPDVIERDVFVCGPEGMTKQVRWALDILKLQPEQIHTEAFRF